MKIMVCRLNGQCGPEILVAFFILRVEKFGLAQRSFQIGKQVRQRLLVIPDVRARAMTAAVFIATAFPRPDLAIRLTQNGG